MTKLQHDIFRCVIKHSKNDNEYLQHIKKIFSINTLCTILIINRNKYNYLIRSKQYDNELLKLKGLIGNE